MLFCFYSPDLLMILNYCYKFSSLSILFFFFGWYSVCSYLKELCCRKLMKVMQMKSVYSVYTVHSVLKISALIHTSMSAVMAKVEY